MKTTMTNMAVATVATSSRDETSRVVPSKNRRYAASVEEDEDEEALQAKKKPTLPTNGQHTIMKESEFMNHSEKGATGPDRPTKTIRDHRKPEK